MIAIESSMVSSVAQLLMLNETLLKGLEDLKGKENHTFTLNERSEVGVSGGEVPAKSTTTNALSPLTFEEVESLWKMRIAKNLHALSELGIQVAMPPHHSEALHKPLQAAAPLTL